MAENDESQEKTEEPTERRLEKAFEEGSLTPPQDTFALGAWIALAASVPLFSLGAFGMAARTADLGQAIAQNAIDSTRLAAAMLAEPALPVFGTLLVLLAVALFVGFAHQRFQLQVRPLRASLKNISPLSGFGRIFGKNAIIQTLFSALKLMVAALVLSITLAAMLDRFLLVAITRGAAEARALSMEAVLLLGATVLGLLLSFAVADILVKRTVNRSKLRMSRQEMKEELKDTEGRPEIKSKLAELRRKRRSTSRKHPVQKADVMVVNPTHYAVAILYEQGRMAAPIVIAKGTGLMARRLRWIAWKASIPIVQAAPIARRLYRDVDVDEPIPEDSFADVAQILVRVYQMRRRPGESPAQVETRPD